MHEQGENEGTVIIPEIIYFYNSTKGGVDTLKELYQHTYIPEIIQMALMPFIIC